MEEMTEFSAATQKQLEGDTGNTADVDEDLFVDFQLNVQLLILLRHHTGMKLCQLPLLYHEMYAEDPLILSSSKKCERNKLTWRTLLNMLLQRSSCFDFKTNVSGVEKSIDNVIMTSKSFRISKIQARKIGKNLTFMQRLKATEGDKCHTKSPIRNGCVYSTLPENNNVMQYLAHPLGDKIEIHSTGVLGLWQSDVLTKKESDGCNADYSGKVGDICKIDKECQTALEFKDAEVQCQKRQKLVQYGEKNPCNKHVLVHDNNKKHTTHKDIDSKAKLKVHRRKKVRINYNEDILQQDFSEKNIANDRNHRYEAYPDSVREEQVIGEIIVQETFSDGENDADTGVIQSEQIDANTESRIIRSVVDTSQGVKNLSISTQRSNLKKRESTPCDDRDIPPKKRIRFPDAFSEHYVERTSIQDFRMQKRYACDEEVFWISSSSYAPDYDKLTVEFVKTSMVSTTITDAWKSKSFNMDVGCDFIDSISLEKVIQVKKKMNEAGAFRFENLYLKTNLLSSNVEDNAHFFHWRNAVKLANLDALFNFELVKSHNSDKQFFYVDVWETSLGFREYVEKKYQLDPSVSSESISGFGLKAFTPNSFVNRKNQVTKDDSVSSTSEHRSYVACSKYLSTRNSNFVEYKNAWKNWSKGIDVLNLDELRDFSNFILSKTEEKGVDLLLVNSDDILNVYEAVKEFRYKLKFYSYCLLALSCIREGGSFVCKIYDTITPFTVGLMWILHRVFQSLTLHVPTSTSEGKTERFVVCRGYKVNDESRLLRNHLIDIHNLVVHGIHRRKLLKRSGYRKWASIRDKVAHIVPMTFIKSSDEFFEYMRFMNIKHFSLRTARMKAICKMLLMDQSSNETRDLELAKARREALKLKQKRLFEAIKLITADKTADVVPDGEAFDDGDDDTQLSEFLSPYQFLICSLPTMEGNGLITEIF